MVGGKKMANSKKRPRTKKPYVKRGEDNVDDIKTASADTKTEGCNDPSWYVPAGIDPSLVGSISFNNPVGYPLTDGNTYLKTPGIMCITYKPSVGYSAYGHSAVNMAARNLYSFVRHANSGHTNYEAPDLMMYCLAVGQAYAYHAEMCRVYGILNTASAVNRYMPKAEITALGYNYDDLMAHMPDLLWFINQYAVKLGTFGVPANMNVIKRWTFMNANVYTDTSNMKSQFYVYKPKAWYKIAETASTTGTSLQPLEIETENATFQTLCDRANQILTPLLTGEEFGIMSGDILKAYGAEGILHLAALSADYSVLPVYSPEVLQQIHNVKFASASYKLTAITQDATGVILNEQKIASQTVGQALGADAIIDSFLDAPKPEDVIVMTRMTIHNSGNTFPVALQSGTEIPCACEIWYYDGDTTATNLAHVTMSGYIRIGNLKDGVDEAAIKAACDRIALVAAFDYAPAIRLLYNLPSGTTDGSRAQWTTNNSIVIEGKHLDRIHETAVLAELSVPSVAMVK